MVRCAALKANGERCKADALPDAEWCWSHHPAYAQARHRRASKGGKRGGRGRPSAATGELARLQGRFEDLAERVLSGGVERGDAAVVAQLLNGARACVVGSLKAREQEELLDRLEEVEHRLQVNQQRSTRKQQNQQKGARPW